MHSTLTILFLLAAVQGFLLTILLLTRKQNRTANAILGLFVGALSLDLLQSVYYATGAYVEYPHLLGITFIFPSLYGPLFYMYVRLLSRDAQHVEWNHALHFLPALLLLVVFIPIYGMSGDEKIEYARALMTDRPPLFTILNNMLPFYGLTYTALTISVIARHNARIRENYSNIDRINLVWLRTLTVGVAIIWAVVVVGTVLSHVAPAWWAESTGVAVNVCMSILVYAIGYLGLQQPEMLHPPSTDGAAVRDQPAVEEDPGRYARSGLSAAAADEIAARLRESMERDKPYLDGDLTLHKLAERLSVSQHNLSQVINDRLGQNFYDLVNSYRIEEVKRRLLKGDADRFTMLSIALDSGFASKTSFNTIFKKHTGSTPSRFLQDRSEASGEITR